MPSRDIVRERLIEAFASIRCRVVRDNGRCFSFAFADRLPSTWDADFTLCVDSEVYVLDHVGAIPTQTIIAAVTEALKPICPDLAWEAL